MTFYDDVTALLSEPYETIHLEDDGSETPVTLAAAPIEDKSSVTSLKPVSGLDVDESDVELISGQFVSTYASEAGLYIVLVTENPDSTIWAHTLKYNNLDGYNVGLGLVRPAAELRV